MEPGIQKNALYPHSLKKGTTVSQDDKRIKYILNRQYQESTPDLRKKLIIIMPKSNNVSPFFERCKKKKLNKNRITVSSQMIKKIN